MRTLSLAIAMVIAAAGIAAAEPRAVFRVPDGAPHAEVPFELDLVIEGFAEAPAPDLPTLTIADATVTPVGATPNVSRSIQIINGRRAESSTVTWVLRYRVETPKAGTLHVPSTFVQQGGERAAAPAGNVVVDSISTTDDMKLALRLPDRPVFVGETIAVDLVWLFRVQPEEQTFVVPLLSSDAFTITTLPVTDTRSALSIEANGKTYAIQYTSDTTDIGGVQFRRIKFPFFIAPHKVGKIEITPSKIVASLAVGRRDFFGNAATRPFRAVDIARTLDVKPLPETDRPASFAGAVGEQFSIAVKTSRSVVQLGEPIKLEVTVRSNQRLDTLALGKLDTDGGLPKDKFAVPDDPPTGALAEDGLSKTFEVTAQVIGPATEIPAIAFAYFDPAKTKYETIHSDPIALSVKGGSIVGADAVFTKKTGHGSDAPVEDLTQVPVELSLSAGGSDAPMSGALLWLLVGLLYAIPIAIYAYRTWHHKTRDERADRAEVRIARKRVEGEIDRAKTKPARDAVGPLVVALRDYGRVVDKEPGELVGKLETAAFAPSAAAQPLADVLRNEVAALVAKWGSAAVLILAFLVGARAAQAATIDDARVAYSQAMSVNDAAKRKIAFQRAEALFGEVVKATPDAPAFLADHGNAALGAGDVATATLAYRRALAIDGNNARAKQNLAWLREKQPDAFQPTAAGAADSLFWFNRWPRSRRMLLGAVAFAACVLLLVPWTGKRRRLLVGLGALPLAIWVAMLVSLVTEDRKTDDAVAMDDVVLRAADSAGAPAAFNQTVPRGAEVTILETRGAWSKIRIPSSTMGWVQSGAIQPVVPR